MAMLVRPQASHGDKTVVDGVAVAVVDMEHSSSRFTNTITHSYDTVVSITMPSLHLHPPLGGGAAASRAPTKEIRVFCKSRQGELFRIDAQAIQDVRRRYVDGDAIVVVEVDFVAAAPVLTGTQAPFAALATKMREYRATFQVLRDEGKTELLFGAILAAWRMTTNTSTPAGTWNTPTLLQPAVAFDAAGTRIPQSAGAFAFPYHRASEASKWVSSPPPHTNAASDYTILTDAEDTFPLLARSGASSVPPASSTLRTDVELRHATRRETERMLNNCSQLETELQLIRQRRQQRQQQLMQVDSQGPTGMSTSFTGDPWALSESTAVAAPASSPHVDVYDPEALRYGFTTLCPHCGIHSTNSHRETCPKRTVQCMRCRSMMPLSQFATHASLCVRQRDPSNKNHVPLSPDPYLSGAAAPSPDDDGDNVGRAQERLVPRGSSSSHFRGGAREAAPPADAHVAAPSRSSTATRLAGVPAAAGPSEHNGGASPAAISFADIPRTRSVIVEKEDRDAEQAQELQQRQKSIRFVDDAVSSPPSDRTRTPRRRLTTFVDNPVQTCPWCKKPAPDNHPKKCAERRILCTLCGEEVFLRDKRAHRAACAAQLEAAATTGLPSRNDDEYDDDLQRRLSKIAAYKKRLDTLRRANELNGTPAGRRPSSN